MMMKEDTSNTSEKGKMSSMNVNHNDKRKIILAIDVGSSSVRCSTYEQQRRVDDTNEDGSEEKQPSEVFSLEGCFASRKIAAVMPNSGKIHNVMQLLDGVDSCIDDTLALLREHYDPFQIVGIGISSFVMNLVGVNSDMEPIGDWASMSYACNSPAVGKECQKLRQELGPEKVKQMYQQTGSPIHSAYAIPQLRELYQNNNYKDAIDDGIVFGWQTVSNLCLSRWTGYQKQKVLLPISYSEASWTGMFNFRTCTWHSQALELLPSPFQHTFPPLVDYNDTDDYLLKNGIPPYVEETVTNKDNDEKQSGTYKSTNPYWERWPELRGNYQNHLTNPKNLSDNHHTSPDYCQLFFGLGDGATAINGSKCFTPFRIAVTIGTSSAARICIPLQIASSSFSRHDNHDTSTLPSSSKKIINPNEFHVPQGLFCYRIDKAHVLLGGALTDGGSVIEWARNLLSLNNDKDFSNCTDQCLKMYEQNIGLLETSNDDITTPVTDDSVIFIPFLSGERSIGYRDNAKGCLLGLTRKSSPEIVLKACMEGIILRIQAILSLLVQQLSSIFGTNVETSNSNDHNQVQQLSSIAILASGTALERNPLWRQMMADCSSIKVLMDSDCKEGSSKGAAVLVNTALTKPSSMPSDALQIIESNIPRMTSYWKRAQEAQSDAIETISSLW